MRYLLTFCILLAASCSFGQQKLIVNDGTGRTFTQMVQSLGGTSITAKWPGTNGTSGYVLSTDGANPALLSWIPAPGGMTNPMTTLGDMIYENSTPAPARLGIGSAYEVLNVDHVSGTPAWAALDITNSNQFAGTGFDANSWVFWDGVELTDINGPVNPYTLIGYDISGNPAIMQVDLSSGSGMLLNYLEGDNGGTGNLTPYVTGDILYYDGAAHNDLAKLPIGSTGDVLTVTAGVPSWQPGGSGPTDFVKTDPATTLDNTIVPSADITELTIRGYSSQTNPLLSVTNSGNTFAYLSVTTNGIQTQAPLLECGSAGNPSQIEVQDGGGSFFGIIDNPTLTANRTWHLPDATGTIALTSDIPASGSYIKNQTSSQTSASFNITNSVATVANIASTYTAGTATALTLTATTSNLSHANQGLSFNVSGGGSNYDLVGTSGNWLLTSAGALTLGAPLTVPNGGTGLATLTAHNILTGNGTSALNSVAPGTSGNLLTSNGTDWISAVPTASYTVAQVIEIDNINSTSTDALTMKNVTASTNSVPQWSPRARLSGTTWSGAASVVADWIAENQTGIAANDQSDYVLSKGLAGTYIQELRIATDNGGTAPTFTFGGQSSATQGAGVILNAGKTPSVTAGGGDCFINGQNANGSNQFGGNFIWQVGLSTGNKDGQSAIIRSSFKGGSGGTLTTAAKMLTLTPVTTGVYQIANATFGNNTGPVGGKIIVAEVTVVSSNIGITIPDATAVTIQPAATVPFAITMPTGVAGAWLVIFNNTAQPTTGTVIAAGATNSFMYLGGAWQHIQ